MFIAYCTRDILTRMRPRTIFNPYRNQSEINIIVLSLTQGNHMNLYNIQIQDHEQDKIRV